MGRRWKHGEIELRYDANEGSFSAWYFEHRLPIAPERYSEILRMRRQGSGEPRTARPASAFSRSPPATRGCAIPTASEAPAFKAELQAIAGGAEIIERGLAAYRAGPDRAAPTLALHHLLERQHYRLGHWRLASSDINYRRFFDVNTLAGLRVEDAGTFDATHTPGEDG